MRPCGSQRNQPHMSWIQPVCRSRSLRERDETSLSQRHWCRGMQFVDMSLTMLENPWGSVHGGSTMHCP